MTTQSSNVQLAPNAQPLDLWAKALEKLNDDDKALIVLHQNRLDILGDVLSLVRQKEVACQKKRWKWKNRQGKTIIIRDVLKKIIIWCLGIGDTIVQYDPGHAALPWVAARFVLQATINDIQTNAAMLEGLEIVFNLIAKLEVVEQLYLPKQTVLHSRLTNSIIMLYASILEFLVQAGLYFEQKTSTRIAKSMFQLEEITTKYITDITSKANEVEGYVRLIVGESIDQTESRLGLIEGNLAKLDLTFQTHSAVDLQANRAADERHRDLQKIWEELHEPITRIANQLSSRDDSLKETDRLAIFDWLSQVPYFSHHRSKVKLLLPGSGKWLLRKPEFVDWLNASASSILWLHGIPGSGKSMLVARVIEYLKLRTSADPDNTSLAYFYCTRNANEPERAAPVEILRSVIEQLSCSAADLPVRLCVVDLYMERKKEAKGRRPEKLELEDCVQIILDLLEDNPATIILDGLDECDPTLRRDLLDSLRTIIQKGSNVVKVFVSSRDDHDLVHRLSQTPNLYIRASDNEEDITNFVLSGVDEAIQKEKILCGNVPSSLRETIVSTLVSQSNGMFRLVSLHIDSLCNPDRIKTRANVLESLKHLPVDLKRSYDTILERVQQSQAPNPMIAERTLKWLLCSRERLRSDSFLIAVQSKFDDDSILGISDILNICCNLVLYDSETDQFRFVHLSVREHLEGSESYSIAASNALAAERCLSWLLTAGKVVGDKCIIWDNTKDSASSHFSVSNISQFWQHADTYWPEYARFAGQLRTKGHLKMLLRQFLLHDSRNSQRDRLIFDSWVTRTSQKYRSSPALLLDRRGYYFRTLLVDPASNPLIVACTFDFSEIVSELISTKPWSLVGGDAAVVYHSHDSLKVILQSVGQQGFEARDLTPVVVLAACFGNKEHLEFIMSKMEHGVFTSDDLYGVIKEVSFVRLPLEDTSLEILFRNNPNLQITEDILKHGFESFNSWDQRRTAQPTVHKHLQIPTPDMGQVLQISKMIRETLDNDLPSRKRGEYYLHLLLKMNARLTEGAVRVLLESCHVDTVRLVLKYQSIDVEDWVIAAAARNVKDGEGIMEILLERELERELET
ncbi:hypothetical protein HYFRA_00007102 [Hymenoscyphus fraxineus]|uniref:NACHT domain-containing protein n=1 Tax=Hymenoscyphus fraxineus TaxID=746836 RepID=A0A9N9PV08_9HELO|nr:hypothetical protein HYFRA_00007102 [Hymenoscyphus fraxineus]